MIQNEFSVPVPVESVERSGAKKNIEADEQERAALAKRFDLIAIDSLSASYKIAPSSMVYHVTGTLNAEITQESVVSGKPLTKTIVQDIDAYYTDYSRVTSFDAEKRKREDDSDDGYEIKDEKDDPEAIIDGILDLGEIAAQFLGLALDTYPKDENEDVADYIEVKPEDAKPNPFAVLKDLNVKK